jgi:hypothetical protein
MADEEAHIVVPGANRHLRQVRALYPAVPPEPAQDSHLGLPPLGGFLGILALGGAILWAAPGRVPYLSTFGDGTVSTRLPEGWCLALEGRSKASGIYIPGQRAAGRILVVCRQIDPGHPPQLRTVGRQRPDAIPVPCKVEVRWEVRFIGAEPLTGNEAVLSLTQSGALMRENQDLLAAYSIPENPPESLDDGWVRYPLAIWVEGEPQMDLLFICYTFPAPGRYWFKPPVLTLVRPGGERQDYPGL